LEVDESQEMYCGEVAADSAPPVASATSVVPAMSESTPAAMSVTALASGTAEMLDSTSAPLIDKSLAKGAAQSSEAPEPSQPAPKKRKVTAPAIVSDSISDK
jgi:hypothetical protein